MIEYIYDFLSVFFDKLKNKENVRTIILFGSVARGGARKDSDIDLFIDTPEQYKYKIMNLIRESLSEFEIRSKGRWHLKQIKNIITPIVDDINLERWKELRDEISLYGKVLYGNFNPDNKKEKNALIIEYDISKLKQSSKMKVIRGLYGYKTTNGKKKYTQKGLIQELGARKISNAILINLNEYKPLKEFLSKNKVPIKIRRAWLEEY